MAGVLSPLYLPGFVTEQPPGHTANASTAAVDQRKWFRVAIQQDPKHAALACRAC